MNRTLTQKYNMHKLRALTELDDQFLEKLSVIYGIDKDDLETERQPSDYYSIFVDLYLMGMGHCFSYGQGGFGRYALLLSYNATCSRRHTWNTKLLPCEWAS